MALRRNIERLITYSQSDEGREKANITESLRAEIAERHIDTEVGSNFSFRIISMQNAGQIPNYEASTAKMFISEVAQRLARTATKVFGLYANLWDADEERAPANAMFTHRYVTTIGRHHRRRYLRDSAQHHRHPRSGTAKGVTTATGLTGNAAARLSVREAGRRGAFPPTEAAARRAVRLTPHGPGRNANCKALG